MTRLDISPLSEALKVNSSLTEVKLNSSISLNVFNSFFLFQFPIIPKLDHQEHHHYQKHWRLIHHSLDWAWNWFNIWMNCYCFTLLVIILVIPERHHWQKHWGLIHHSFGWMLDLCVKLSFLILPFQKTLKKQHKGFRSNITCWITQG